MFTINTYVGKTKDNGIGLFSRSPVAKGEIVAMFPTDSSLITEDTYVKEQRKGNQMVIRTGVRYVGDYFLSGDKEENDSFINHSCDPNLLYHCGILWAKRPIEVGDELTVDYAYFMAPNELSSFTNYETGRTVRGYDAGTALLESTRELLRLLEDKCPNVE